LIPAVAKENNVVCNTHNLHIKARKEKAKFMTTSTFKYTLTDALWKLAFIDKNAGHGWINRKKVMLAGT